MNTQIRSRVITASVGVPLLILIIGWGRAGHFSLLVFLATAIALWEYFFIVFRDRPKERTLGIALGALLSLGIVIPGAPEPGLSLGIVILLIFSTYLFPGGELEKRYQHLSWTLLGVLYIGYLVPHLALLYQSRDGRAWVFFLFLVIMTGDTAGYFAGNAIGKNKLYPEISPGKTVEGAIASLAASVLAGILGGIFLLPAIPWVEILPLSLVLSILGQVGDLFESWIKRVFSVKDSGSLLPGHGGLLDRMDSLIFPVVFTTYYLRLLHP
ncbi:MAG: phosphatidate cytidylyltransferase [Deltaproteobacteria bacterium]|nr:phosphatidate cytidylyltransferase [Deltaproteobacteria bacterium]